MSEQQKLTMKALDERLGRVEEEVADIHLAIQNIANRIPKSAETPEYARDMLVACINALKNQRSQGALRMAQGLEDKYFEGEDMQEIGDRLTDTGGIWSATKGQ